jgi:hypothetical protein
MSEYKDEIIRLRKQGKSYREIESELDCSKGTIAYHCKRERLEDTGMKNEPIDNEKEKKIGQYYKDHTGKETAKKFNVSERSVHKYTESNRSNRNNKTKINIKKCKWCKKLFITSIAKPDLERRRTTCSQACLHSFRSNHSKEVAANTNKRSKNEKYFAELCKEQFGGVKTNEPMFNGWDADVIIKDLKVAILWNGRWHYEKIVKNHSVEQVQNRDKIKRKEIRDEGYIPYTIVDMGKHNKNLVERQFKLFLNTLTKIAG